MGLRWISGNKDPVSYRFFLIGANLDQSKSFYTIELENI
jgi:hypothetical protein